MNIRFTILLVVILVIIGGTVWITQQDDDGDASERKAWVWKVELEDLQRIAITHEDTSVTYRRQDRSWVIEDGNDTPVYQPKWGGKALIVSGPKPSRTLDEEIEDAALYGLDPVATTVEVTDRSGQNVVFELGAITPDGNNQYVRLDDGSLHTLPKIWGEVVIRLATEPPYSPPFISVLDTERVREMKVTVRDADGLSEAIYLLTGEEEGEDEQWILVEGAGVLVQQDRWSELTSGLDSPEIETEAEEIQRAGGDAAFGLDSPLLQIDLRPDRADTSGELRYFVGGEVTGADRYYFREFGTDVLQTVDARWAQQLIALAKEPAVLDAPPDGPAG